MTPVIDLEDYKAIPRQMIDVGSVTLGGAVCCGWDIPVIEYDGFVPAFGGLLKGDRQQAKDLVALRDIADQVLEIIGSVGECFFEGNFTTGDLQVSQVVDRDLFTDFTNDFCFRDSGCNGAGWGQGLCWGVGLAGN